MSTQASAAGGRERHDKPVDVIFVVVKMDRQAQVAIAFGAHDSLFGQHADKPRWFAAAERHADDRALVRFGQVNSVPPGVGQGAPELGGELAVAGVYGVGPELVED